MSRAVVAAALMVVGCSGVAPRVASEGPAPDRREAVGEARGLAREIEGSVGRGQATGLSPLCAIDVVAIGPRVEDDGARPRTDLLLAFDEALPGEKYKLKVRDQQIDSAAGARSAWLTEQVDVDGKRHAVTAIAAEVDGLWVMTAVMIGRQVPDKALRGEPPGALPRLPARASASGPTAGNLPAPDEPLTAFVKAVGDVDARYAQLDGERAVILGAGDKASWRGEKAIRKAWKKGAPRWKLAGDAQAGATPDGELVWIASSATTVEAAGPGRPRRLFAVYRRADRDPPPPPPKPARSTKPTKKQAAPPPEVAPSGPPPAWRLVVLHEAIAS